MSRIAPSCRSFSKVFRSFGHLLSVHDEGDGFGKALECDTADRGMISQVFRHAGILI